MSAAPDGRATATGTALIALDWGTTSARAYRLDANGAVRDVRSAPLGIQHVAEGEGQGVTKHLSSGHHAL